MKSALLFCFLAVAPAAELHSVRVLATADVGCRVRPSPDFEAPGEPRRVLGGWPGLERTISEERTTRTLLIDCGNFAAGSAEAAATWGRAAVRFMNLVGYDAATLGDRDFRWGINNLEALARLAGFPLLADPLLDAVLNRRMPMFRPWVVRDLRGVRVALVGLSDLRAANGSTAGYSPGSPAEQLRRYLPAVSIDTPDVVVAFGQFSAADGELLLDSFPGLGLVVCPDDGSRPGHERLLLVSGGGQRLAVADLLLVDSVIGPGQVARRSINVLPDYPASPGLERLIAEVGVPGEDSVGPRVPVELSRFAAASALAEACRAEAPADIAVVPFDAVGSGLAAGRPRRHELRSVAPYDDRLRLVILPDTLLHALARSIGSDLPAPMIAGAELFVMPGAGDGWPRVRDLARLRLPGRKQAWRVVTTERLLAASGIADPGRLLARTLTGLWLDHAGRQDTLRVPVPPRRVPAGPAMTPVAPLVAGLINVNTADAATLEQLPGIGPMTAGRIIEYRTTVGPFRTVDDLGNVKGIGPKRIERLRPLVTVR